MAVIGIGTASRASVEDVLAVIAEARAKMVEEAQRTPSPQPSPQGERGRRNVRCGEFRGPFSQQHPLADAATLRCKLAKASLLGERQSEGGLFATLAALDRPALNGVLQEAAGRAGLDLVLLTLDELRAAAHLCVTHSEHSMKQYGIPSVAEAAALAGAGTGARLLVPRLVGRNATASVAERP